MKTKMLDIKTQDGNCDTFLTYPDDNGTYPAVLFLMDGIGPRDYLYEMAQTIAAQGYFVLLPNLFYRQRKAPLTTSRFPVRPENFQELIAQIMPLFQTYNPQDSMKDIGVFIDFLGKQKQVKPGKIGVTGYCMGGGLAIRTAALYPDKVGAAASFHGGNLATDTPDSPHLLLNKVKAEIYVAHADKDTHMPPEQIDRLEKALKQSGLRYEAELYKNAAHGFTMADLPAYQEAALKRHWEKLSALFVRNLEMN